MTRSEHDSILEQISAEFAGIVAGLEGIPKNEQLGYIKGCLSKLTPRLRDAVEPLLFQTVSITRRDSVRQTRTQLKVWEKVALLVIGLVLLATVIIIAFVVPNPTPFQNRVFCVTLSLAAAATGALLPGFLKIESKSNEVWIRASGAAALLVLVFLFLCR